MAKGRHVSKLGELLPQVMHGLRGSARPTKEEIQQVWGKVAGPKAAGRSWPRHLEKGRLIVEVENSGWMYTLNLKKTHLLQGLIELLGADRIKTLSFRIGEKKDA